MSNPDKTTIDDIVVLGNAVPDEISDNRYTVCTAGYSKKYGLIRLYPVPPKSPMQRWNVVSIHVERNPKDTREESWKIQDSHEDWFKLHKKIQIVKQLKNRNEQISLVSKLHEEFGVGCIQDLNEKKLSLGMIKPKVLGYRFEERIKYDPSVQIMLDSVQRFLTINNYKEQPRIEYRCSNCNAKNPHDQQLIEWEHMNGCVSVLMKRKGYGITCG